MSPAEFTACSSISLARPDSPAPPACVERRTRRTTAPPERPTPLARVRPALRTGPGPDVTVRATVAILPQLEVRAPPPLRSWCTRVACDRAEWWQQVRPRTLGQTGRSENGGVEAVHWSAPPKLSRIRSARPRAHT